MLTVRQTRKATHFTKRHARTTDSMDILTLADGSGFVVRFEAWRNDTLAMFHSFVRICPNRAEALSWARTMFEIPIAL